MSEEQAEPIFLVDGKRYHLMMWFVPGDRQDFVGVLYKDPGDESWTFRFRFRYYADDSGDPFRSGDRKSVSTFHSRPEFTEEQAIASVNEVVGWLASNGFAPPGRTPEIHKVPMRTADPVVIMEIMKHQEFAHIQTVKMEPAGVATPST